MTAALASTGPTATRSAGTLAGSEFRDERIRRKFQGGHHRIELFPHRGQWTPAVAEDPPEVAFGADQRIGVGF